MKKQTLTQIIILVTLSLLLVSTLAQADVYMKQKKHTGGMQVMGQQRPAEDVVEEIRITDTGFRSDNPKNSVIMLVEGKTTKIIMINHEDKSYMEMPMNMGDMMSKMAKDAGAEDMAAMQNMMKGMMKMDATVTATGEKKKIKGWNCEKYILTLNTFMGVFTNEIWATEDLKMDMDVYAQFSSAMMTAMPGMQDAVSGIMEEMKKIKGVQVLSTLTQNIMNQTVTSATELLEFKNEKAPAGWDNLPTGYKMKSMQR